ncbi:hypothetical protein BCR34DRAFT_611411 [Clohesyomyces aquaticus]|uniref:Aminoglycoside phosphotransferase domain-containing protein n=1 Tax=Clohesyomyces aquaticus TaxID=1231657 RepID=A0A1Y2A209_9PLEO|nr:hypothetical protein BCR34DRAFT_611411 [Clohesyomyces aquaticus]
MVGGYITYILMTKVPGKRIRPDEFSSLSLKERHEIRKAFKEALHAVWKCGVYPRDSTMRNVVWDEQERKCYIVDFEDVEFVPTEVAVSRWNDLEYIWWNLADSVEEHKLQGSKASSEQIS